MSKRNEGQIYLDHGQAKLLTPLRATSLELARRLGWPDTEVMEIWITPIFPAKWPFSVWTVRVHFESGEQGVGCHVLKLLVCDRNAIEKRDGPPAYEVHEVRYGALSRSEDTPLKLDPTHPLEVSYVRLSPVNPLQGWIQAVTFGSGPAVRTLWGSDWEVEPAAAQGETIHWQRPFRSLLEHCEHHVTAKLHVRAAKILAESGKARFYM